MPSDDNSSYVNAIRCLALACRHPLEAFLTKIKKFQNSLGVVTQDKESLYKFSAKGKVGSVHEYRGAKAASGYRC
jgi:hypothetical protein